MPPSPIKVHLALLTVSLLFGANYVFSKHILADVPLRAWVQFRMTAAMVLLVGLAVWLRKRGLPDKRMLLGLGIAAFFGTSFNQILYTEGLARTTPEHSAVVNACIPTFTMIVAVAVGQERLSGRLVAAIGSALLGMLYLLGVDQMLMGTQQDVGGATLLGDLLSMGNAFSFAIHLVIMRRLAKHVDPWVATAILFVYAVIALLPWSYSALNAEAVDAVLQPSTLWMAIYIVLGATVLTYVLNNWALQHTRSSQVALYINVQPLVAAMLSTAMGAPMPGHRFFVALLLVAFALWLQTRVKE